MSTRRPGIVIARPRIAAAARSVGLAALWILGGGALVVFVFALSFYLAMRADMRSSEVKVPELTGLTLEAATTEADAMRLVLQVADQRHDPAVPSGHVLQQDPPPGVAVRRGRKIKLVLSLGGQVLTVPDLVGDAARAVAIELRQGGFTPGQEVRVPSADLPQGRVLAQVPPAETPAVPNTRVHRLVSDGPPRPTWVMPDLTGLTRGYAESWLERARFRLALRRVRMPGRQSGTVVGQLPLAGHPVRSNDIVELTVAQ